MSYLTTDNIENLAKSVKLVPLDDGYRLKDFDCGIQEYNVFLEKESISFECCCISKTHLLINKKNADIIGYISLCTDSIKLSVDEKQKHGMENIELASIPSLKIGKLAVNKKYCQKTRGYGSLLIELARGYVNDLNKIGVACRFITVDADIEYNPDTIEFYKKNGFIFNEIHNSNPKKRTKTLSMRLEIFNDIEQKELVETGTGN